MARWRAKKGRRSAQSRFVALPHWIMNSHAWRRLTPVEKCTWLEICSFYNGSNNGVIAAPGRLIGDRLNVSHHTVARALKTLITLGFIESTKRSDFSRKTREASEYRLTHLKCDLTGQLPTKTFMRLGSTSVEVAVPVPSDPPRPDREATLNP